MLEGMEMIPRRVLEYRGRSFEEMDVDAIVARHPDVALVDELPHTNIPGSRRAKRWEDALDLLAEGITVITTVNIQHLESLNDVIAAITGIRQKETLPDWLIELADDIELVDSSPHALQRRMMHGNIYPDPAKADLALRRFFTGENLTALRELALMRVANRVDEELVDKWKKGAVPETRERVLVCIGHEADAESLVRRGARMAQRAQGDLFVLHVRTHEDLRGSDWLTRIERLTQDLGGEFQTVDADSVVDGVLSFAYRNHVTQCVVGEPMRPWWQEFVRGSFVNRLIRKASSIDVHVIARKER
jgi:two-component system sensor histidine kinase KdpD